MQYNLQKIDKYVCGFDEYPFQQNSWKFSFKKHFLWNYAFRAFFISLTYA